MNKAAYEAIAGSQLMHDYAAAFHQATGLALRIAPAQAPPRRHPTGNQENAFCQHVNHITGGCRFCAVVQRSLLQRLEKKLAPQQVRCPAGLTDVAVPVLVGGEHVATLFGGQVFRQKVSRRDFGMVARLLERWGVPKKDLPRFERAYLTAPVVPDRPFQAIVRLLTFFAQQLADSANRWILAKHSDEPSHVSAAKEFVRAHLKDRLHMHDAASHVGLSPYYFCRLFTRTTRMPFTEYVSRVRVERAKELVTEPNTPIGEAALASGFQSIPHFNRMFKRYAGMTPVQYRSAARADVQRAIRLN